MTEPVPVLPVQVLRPAAEVAYAEELDTLARSDDRRRPPNWKMSPRSVVRFLMGDAEAGISAKFIGDVRLIEVAVTTLATDRSLHLMGVPGTGKSMVSELLAAAISGNSRHVIQGTAGTDESAVRYGWNYAVMLSKGTIPEAMVPSPIMRAMTNGTLARVEELTRIGSEVQDAFLSILSEKSITVPELDLEIAARPGFSVIATSNARDRGVNELSSALKRRLNTVILPSPDKIEDEVRIVEMGVKRMARDYDIGKVEGVSEQIRRVVAIFRELRSGVTENGKDKVKSVSGTLSSAEAISIVTQGMSMAEQFGEGVLTPHDYIHGLRGAVVQDGQDADKTAWKDYVSVQMVKRWPDLHRAARDLG